MARTKSTGKSQEQRQSTGGKCPRKTMMVDGQEIDMEAVRAAMKAGKKNPFKDISKLVKLLVKKDLLLVMDLVKVKKNHTDLDLVLLL